MAQPSLAPAHQQREGVTIHHDDSERLAPLIKEMFEKARDWVGVEATNRIKERSRRLVLAEREGLLPSVEAVAPFMRGLNYTFPVINVPADVEKFDSVWQAFMGGNNHFSLSDIRHIQGTGGRENETYKLDLLMKLEDLSNEARDNVIARAAQMEFPFNPEPPLVIEGKTIRLVTTFSPTSPFSTQQHLENVSQVMASLKEAIENQQ